MADAACRSSDAWSGRMVGYLGSGITTSIVHPTEWRILPCFQWTAITSKPLLAFTVVFLSFLQSLFHVRFKHFDLHLSKSVYSSVSAHVSLLFRTFRALPLYYLFLFQFFSPYVLRLLFPASLTYYSFMNMWLNVALYCACRSRRRYKTTPQPKLTQPARPNCRVHPLLLLCCLANDLLEPGKEA